MQYHSEIEMLLYLSLVTVHSNSFNFTCNVLEPNWNKDSTGKQMLLFVYKLYHSGIETETL